MRIDRFLVMRGDFESRSRAAEAIRKGLVSMGGRTVLKPAEDVDEDADITVEKEKFYVSRAAKKLESYLKEYAVDIAGCCALDIGSSTGGFTQILLESGVSSVDAVDVGRDQMHPVLRRDRRVKLYEGTDIRDFKSTLLYDLIVSDVSFISLHHILPDIVRLAEEDADIILLFKPQFEVGRDAKRSRRGVVLDKKMITEALERFKAGAENLGWRMIRMVPSFLKGREGNREYFFHFRAPEKNQHEDK